MEFLPSPEAVQLFLEGSLALSEVEAQGVRVDKAYLDSALDSTARQIKETEDKIRADPDFKTWRKLYGEKTNIGAPEQLAGLVFGALGHSSKVLTKSKKRASASKKALEGVDRKIVKLYFDAQRLRKGRDTFLVGIQRELVRHAPNVWKVHPSFHLNTAISYRSSCSSPNLQNQPVRNQVLADMIRKCFIPEDGDQILEVDLGQIEVRVPPAYSFDPNLIAYCCDPTKDMHADMGCQIFKLESHQLDKAARHVAKNMCVFPMFYGSYYAQMAPDIWDAIDRRELKLKGSDLTIREWLRDSGITELGECDPDERPVKGTFEYHLKEIEDDFWGNRFAVHAQWKRKWIEDYHKNGGCRSLTGFITTGPHKRNDITSYCIQGDAFHLLLWSMIRINNRLRRYKFKTRVIFEVHDSLNFNCKSKERDDVIDLCMKVMTQDIKEYAPWLNVPIVAEAELCPIDRSWFDKASLKRDSSGLWIPADMDGWAKKYGDWSLQC